MPLKRFFVLMGLFAGLTACSTGAQNTTKNVVYTTRGKPILLNREPFIHVQNTCLPKIKRTSFKKPYSGKMPGHGRLISDMKIVKTELNECLIYRQIQYTYIPDKSFKGREETLWFQFRSPIGMKTVGYDIIIK